MKRKYILHSPRIEELKKKKRRILRNKMIFFVFCFLVLLIGLVFLSRWEKINIDNIQISGNKVVETEAIEAVVQQNLTGHYLGLFPKTNFLLYPKKQIKNELENQFKRFSDVSIGLDNIKTLKISVTEREGKYLWCGTLVPVLINDTSSYKCYFMDQNGYIFDEAPYFSGNVYFKFYGPDSGDPANPIGTYFLKDKFEEIAGFKNTLKEFGMNPADFWLDKNGDANISLSSEPDAGPKIIFKINSDYEKIAESLQAAITTEPLQTELTNKFSSLLYIDLRFGNNVYYKFSAQNESVSGGQ
jgi:hypothetical protein